jgi:rhodanese-related sulfurtransferase
MFKFFGRNVKENIDVEKFNSLRTEGYKIIDVRTPEEYNEARIENSILIDFYESDFYSEIDKLDKSEKFIVYCRSGRRSLTAVKYMNSIGIENAFNLEGGIIDWKSKGNPIVK